MESPETNKASSTGLSITMHALVMLDSAGTEPPPALLDALAIEIKGMVMGSPNDEEKVKLREVATKLPDAQRELVLARFG